MNFLYWLYIVMITSFRNHNKVAKAPEQRLKYLIFDQRYYDRHLS